MTAFAKDWKTFDAERSGAGKGSATPRAVLEAKMKRLAQLHEENSAPEVGGQFFQRIAAKVATKVKKDWAQYDAERGTGEKVGRAAGAGAGSYGAARVARGIYRLARARGLRRVPAVAGAGLAAYATFNAARGSGGYVGRKVDGAISRVFKDWSQFDANRPKTGRSGGSALSDTPVARAIGGGLGGAYGGATGGVLAAGLVQYAGDQMQRRAGGGVQHKDVERLRRAEELARRPGTPGEGAAAEAAAARLRAKIAQTPGGGWRRAGQLLSRVGRRAGGFRNGGALIGAALGAAYGAKRARETYNERHQASG